jgi:hypothetical protein
MSIFSRGWLKIALWLCFIVPLGAQAYVGTFSRYFADDYCLTGRLITEGFFGSMLWWYNNWSGRFSYWIFIAISGSVEPRFAAIFPVLLLGFWLIGLIWIAYELGSLLGNRKPVYFGCLMGTLILFATLDGTPSVFQSLYWFSSTIPYTLPLIPFTFYVGLFLYTLRKTPGRASLRTLFVMGLLTMFAGGLCEVHAAFQFTALAIIWGVLYRYAPRSVEQRARSMLVVGMASSLIALVIVAVAPGNSVRQILFPVQFSLPELVIRTILYSGGYMALALGHFSPIALLVTVVVSAMTAYLFPGTHGIPSARKIRQWILLSTLAVFILTMATLALPLYGLGTAPSSRVYLTPQLALVCAAVFWGYLMGVGLRSRRDSVSPSRKLIFGTALAVLLIVGPLASTWQTLTQLPDFQSYAVEWDQRDQGIRTAIGQGVERFATIAFTVDLGAKAGLDIITSNPSDWVNVCAAMYYGLDSITAEPLWRMGNKA